MAPRCGRSRLARAISRSPRCRSRLASATGTRRSALWWSGRAASLRSFRTLATGAITCGKVQNSRRNRECREKPAGLRRDMPARKPAWQANRLLYNRLQDILHAADEEGHETSVEGGVAAGAQLPPALLGNGLADRVFQQAFDAVAGVEAGLFPAADGGIGGAPGGRVGFVDVHAAGLNAAGQ